MNARQLQYVIALSESLNMSQTAELLGISQPALSKHVLNLERELDVKLFDRATIPMTLTAAGEYFIREARELQYRQDQLMQSMDAFRTGAKGNLVIGISPFRSQYLMPSIAKKFKEKYPDVRIILHEATSSILRKEAAEGKYDFALVNLPVDESVLDITAIEPDTLVLAVPKSMADGLLCHGEQIRLEDCAVLPFIVVSQSQELRQLFDKMWAAAGIHPNITMEVVGISTAWNMVCAEIGATILPLQFIKHKVISDEVRLFTLENSVRSRQPVIVTKKGQFLSEYAKYAMDLLANNAEN